MNEKPKELQAREQYHGQQMYEYMLERHLAGFGPRPASTWRDYKQSQSASNAEQC